MGYRMPLTLSERKEIKKLLGTMSMTKIAERMNRSKNGIVVEVRINGGPEEYDPVKAHKAVEARLKENKDKQLAMIKKQNNDMTIKNNIDYLTRKLVEFEARLKSFESTIQGNVREFKSATSHMDYTLDRFEDRLECLSEVEEKIKKFSALEKEMKRLQKEINASFLSVQKKKADVQSKPEQFGYMIPFREWGEYHKWPNRNELDRFFRDRENNGFNEVLLKPDRHWFIDEEKFFVWAENYKDQVRKLDALRQQIKDVKPLYTQPTT